MRLPRRSKKPEQPAPEDTQEMFTAGESLPESEDEVAVEEEEVEVEEELEVEPEPEPVEDLEGEYEYDDEYEEDWEDEDEDADEGDDDAVEPERDSDGADPEEEPRSSTVENLKVRSLELLNRAKAAWMALLKRIGAIQLPSHELDGQKVLAVSAIVLAAGLVGGAGYLLGKGSGDNLDTARLEGEFEGKQVGAVEGTTKGYTAGFKKGRDLAFRKAYAASYRRNYIRAYTDVGLEAPKAKNIKVPRP